MFKLFFIPVLLPIFLCAQEIKPVVENTSLRFSIPDVLKKAGLKKAKVIFTDSRYLTWIGTENGLYRYDGTSADYLRHYNNKEQTLPSNNITGITEDKTGRLWVGTMSGVALVNPFSLQCKRYRQKDGRMTSDFDNKPFVDGEGKIWVGNSGGLELYDATEDRFERVWRDENPKEIPVSTYVTSICTWANDSLVLGTFVDLAIVSKKNFGFRRVPLANHAVTVMDLTVDAVGRLWVGTWGYGGFFFDQKMNRVQNFVWPSNLEKSRILRHISAVQMGGEACVLLTLGNGLLKVGFDKKNRPQFDRTIFYNAPAEIEALNYFFPVNANTLLVAGTGGVANFSALYNRFIKLPIPASCSLQEPKEILFDGHRCLVEPTWHSGEGVFVFDEETSRYKQFTCLPITSAEGKNISALVPDSRGRFWCASFGGVTVVSKEGKVLFDISELKNADSLTRPKTNGLFIRNDTVWVVCYKAGIDLYDLNFKKLGHLQVSDSAHAESPVWKIFGDRKNRVWLCGNEALWQYQPATKRFRRIDLSEEKSGCTVNDAVERSNGHLAIATSEGLVDFDPETEDSHVARTLLLQKEDAANSVTEDATGQLWFVTENHLVCYNPTNNHFALYDEKDGIETRKELQWIKTFDGHRFYLAQSDGVYSFYPEQWTKEEERPRLLLHQVQVADSNWLSEHPLSSLELKHNQNKIYVEFDGINYEKPEQNLYASLLQPLEKGWNYSARNFVQYSNLSPGRYTLHLKAANEAGRWSNEYVLSIYIAPPFWLTWWFLLSAGLLLVTVLVLIVRYISQRNLREKILRLEKQTAVEKERNRIAQDMHDDLGSGLTKIAILSEVAKTQLRGNDAAAAPLQKISASSRELVDSLQDIIWVLNPRNDSLENTAAYLREYALKFFESTATHVSFCYPSHIPAHKLSEEQRRSLFLVMKESLNNVAKHAEASEVEIALNVSEKNFSFFIRDNGKGFESATVRQWSNGLRNMQQRMTQIGGTYSIQSEKEKGTLTLLSLPL